jgi:hypothetical protein
MQDFINSPISNKYDNVLLSNGNILIEVFRYKTKEGLFSESSGEELPTIFIQDPLDGSVKTNKEVFVDYTHVAKILKSADGNYKEGDCVLLNPYETTNVVRNPQWIHYMEYINSRGMEVIPPKDLREWIPSIQVHYIGYQFLLPEEYDKKVQDVTTFLIPSHKVVKWAL